jgi:hypothetical protein
MRLWLQTVLIALALFGLMPMQAQAQHEWVDKIAGEYVGRLVDSDGEKPVLTILRRTTGTRSNATLLSGEYTYGADRVPGRLEACAAAGPRLLRCTWIDRFGRGVLELEFDEALTSFRGRWSADGIPGVSFPWNGRRPAT